MMKSAVTMTVQRYKFKLLKFLPVLIVTVLAENGFGFLAAHAISFNVKSGTSVPQDAVNAFTNASQFWSSQLKDNVTINLDIQFGQLGSNVLGSALPVESSFAYETVRGALLADVTSSNDAIATGNLQAGPAFNLLINYTSDSPNGYGSSVPYLDNDGGSNNRQIRITSANAKALGLQTNSAQDGSITFNSNINWDFNPSNGISRGTFDFFSVATHEIGHVLGFISGIDLLDDYSPFQVNGSDFFFPENTFSAVSILDLYRFSNASTAYGAGIIDWTANSGSKYFSIDGGRTALGEFSTGISNGNGKSASHWARGQNLGLMNPDVARGEALSFSTLDRTAFDVLGWDVERSSQSLLSLSVSASDSRLGWTVPATGTPLEIAESVPEPAPIKGLLAAMGVFGMIGFGKRAHPDRRLGTD